MNNNILKNSRITFFSLTLALASVVSLGIFTQSCSKDEEPLDESILNSSELEEYIISGADFKQSLAIFTDGLNKIDFSSLEVTYTEDGRKVVHLPTSVASIRIEEKVQVFNEKKEALLKKFPQFSSMREEIGKKYLQQCAKSSVNVCGKFLEFGIIPTQPKLKNGFESTLWYGEDWGFLMSYLNNWVNTSNNVEMCIISFADGTYMTYTYAYNYANPGKAWVGGFATTNGYYYFEEYQSSHVVWFAHTHFNSSNPSSADNTFKNNYPNMGHSIYYQGGFYYW